MKNLLKFVTLMCLVVMSFTCTSDSDDDILTEFTTDQLNNPCVDESPITRVVNNGTVTFDFKVINDQGDTLVHIPVIPANTTTSWANFEAGEVLFSLDSNQSLVQDDKVLLQMDNCMAYDIEINSNNEIVSYIPTIL